MRLLLLDTAGGVFSAAICAGNRLLGETCGSAGPMTAARLAPAVDRLLADCNLEPAELEGLAVTVGPGSFTGLRVGIAFIKGMAWACGKPVVGLSSLQLLAMNAIASELPVCPLFDARKNEVYGGLFAPGNGMSPLMPEAALPPETFLSRLDGETLFLGDGAVRYRETISTTMGSRAHFVDPGDNTPRAAAGIPLAQAAFAAGAAVAPADLLPRYLRLSEAELQRAS